MAYDELTKEIESQLLSIAENPSQRLCVDNVNRLLESMGSDIRFDIHSNVTTVNYTIIIAFMGVIGKSNG